MFHLTIKTPYEDVFAGEVDSISLTAEDGDMQVFENHASVTATLAFSPLVVAEEGKEEHFLARSGIFLFDNETNSAKILASYCEKKSEVNYQTIKEYADFISKMLAEGHELSEFQLLYLKGEKVAVEQQMEEIGNR